MSKIVGITVGTPLNPDKFGSNDVDLDGYAKSEEIPTKVSQLENDKGYLTKHQDLTDYAKKSDIPNVPTKVSELENDKGYLTEHHEVAWEDVKNRPFGESSSGENIVWNGNTDGLEFTSFEEDGIIFYWYRVSDKFIPIEDMLGSSCYTTPEISPDENGSTYIIEEPTYTNDNGSFAFEIYVVSVNSPNTMFDFDGWEVMFPEEGIWFFGGDFGAGFGYVANLISTSKIIQLDEKFIPDTIARKEDIENIDFDDYYDKSEIDRKFSEFDLALSSAIGSGVLE